MGGSWASGRRAAALGDSKTQINNVVVAIDIAPSWNIKPLEALYWMGF